MIRYRSRDEFLTSKERCPVSGSLYFLCFGKSLQTMLFMIMSTEFYIVLKIFNICKYVCGVYEHSCVCM